MTTKTKPKTKAKAKAAPKAKSRARTALQKRGTDTVVYVRFNPALYAKLEEMHNAHCEENLLNPKQFGIGTMIREIVLADTKRKGV